MESTTSLIVALAALVPGLVAWWTGRRLVRLADDPALPELLLGQRQRALKIFAGLVAFILIFGGRESYWAIPLLVVVLIAGSYPLTRTLGHEAGGIARYGWRRVKSVGGRLGFWLVLALTPEIVLSIDPAYRPLSLALLVLLLAWENWSGRVWLWAHDAVPLANAEVERRAAAIAERAGTPAPRLYRVGGDGSRYMNAVAIPSARHPAIGLGNALLELLDLDEVAAIYAHELSHIEQHSPRSLRRVQAANRVLILLGVFAPFAVGATAPSWRWLVPVLWPLALVTLLVRRGRKRKQRETESDLRAAALCGDAEVVARALVKLHVHALIPRRLPADLERGASHPSLARRIQALRAAASSAVAEATLGAPVVLPSARAGSVVVFDDERAHWFDGVPAGVPHELQSLRAHAASVRSVIWNELIELRVATAGAERTLRATHRNGESWSVPLATTHVRAVQRLLDRVDVRLHRELGAREILDPRLIAMAALIAMFWTGDAGVLFVPAGLTVLWPRTAALAALGAMACGAALLDALRASRSAIDALFPPAVLAIVGAVALWRVRRRMRAHVSVEAPGSGSRTVLVVLAALLAVVIPLAAVAAAELPATAATQPRVLGTLAVVLAGMAAALITTPARRARAAAAVLATAGVIVALPSVHARDAAGTDRFTRSHVTATPIGRVVLPPSASSVRLSPDGEWFLARHFEPYSDANSRDEFALGSRSGVQRELSALQAEFAGSDRILTLRRAADSLAIELQSVDSSGVLWRHMLPAIDGATLAVSPRDGAWLVMGIGENDGTQVVASGRIGAPSDSVRRLPRPYAAGSTLGGVIHAGARLIVPVYQLDRRAGLLAAFGLQPLRVDLWEIDAVGHRPIGSIDGVPQCGAADGGFAACIVRLRDRSDVWSLGSRGGPSLLESLPFRIIGRVSIGPAGRMTLIRDGRSVSIVDLSARRLVDVDVGSDSAYPMEASSVPGRLAVLRRGGAETAVTLYNVP